MSVSVAAALTAAFVTHLLTSRRDHRNRIREMRLGYLRDLYLKLMEATQDRELSQEDADKLMSALTEVQLLGDQEHIAQLEGAINSLRGGSAANMGNLTRALRDTVRSELRLAPIIAPPYTVSIKVHEEPSRES
ncbi:hypothetical protein [Streptomyces sp. NPDC052494]|uniref:hypothetical protein n=1 Tax=Streptomyces sp. NPDC052494 TaxID=3365692 RepID=UPI0037D3BC34